MTATRDKRVTAHVTDHAVLEAGRLPGRKRPCIWLLHEGRIMPLAYFVSDEAFNVWMAAEPSYRRDALLEAMREHSPGGDLMAALRVSLGLPAQRDGDA